MCFCGRLVVTKCLKVQLKTGSLLIDLFCIDTTLVHPWKKQKHPSENG